MVPLGRLRRLARYRRIAQLLVAHGVGYAAAEALPQGLYALFRRRPPPSREVGVRVRRLLEDLGPTFVKLGQILSTRPDLVPHDIIRELEHLQDDVPSETPQAIRAVLESELGRPVEEVFPVFRWDPIASASLGQVHEASLPTGEAVVVKVQRPNVRQTIEADLGILGDVFHLLSQLPGLSGLYDPDRLVDEFSRSLLAELDYTREGRNADRMRRNFEKSGDHVIVPRVFWSTSRSRVLTMERIVGVKPTDPDAMRARHLDPSDTARTVATAILRSVFVFGFFHADPHPGNLIVQQDGRVALLDFGMVGRLSEPMRGSFADLSLGLLRGNSLSVVGAITDLGATPPDLDRQALLRDVEDLRDRYYEVSLRELNLGQVVQDIFAVAYRHRIRIPLDFTLLAKCLVTMEGVVEVLDPSLSILEIARPFGATLVQERLSPRRIIRRLERQGETLGHALLGLPVDLADVARKASEGRLTLRVESENPRAERSSRRLARARVLSTAGGVSALVGAVYLIAAALRPTAFPLPLIPIGTFILSLLLFWQALRQT